MLNNIKILNGGLQNTEHFIVRVVISSGINAHKIESQIHNDTVSLHVQE